MTGGPEHHPIAPFTILEQGNTILVIAACWCGGDCAMTAGVMPEQFFTPSGDPGVRLDMFNHKEGTTS